jgi:hypothetical protein
MGQGQKRQDSSDSCYEDRTELRYLETLKPRGYLKRGSVAQRVRP